ncbi:urease accessory protein UreF [Acetobacteraceae bacterium]|nr:urease accessory protein UreF [Acetobacteraceae bacterium]
MKAVGLIKILQFSDSVLPVGAFAFSNGLESAIQSGIVHDLATLKDFTRAALQQSAMGDGRAVVATCQALKHGERETAILNDRALLNRRLNEEGRMMLLRMGKKLAEMAASVTEEPLVRWWLEQIKSGATPGTYPMTQAVLMTALGASAREIIVMQHYSVASTILNAAIRLMRVTHIEIQCILFALNQEIEQFCAQAECGGIEQMASYAPVTDILASLHVGAFTRLFST